MLGKELHPDRVIQVEKLYEIFNKYGIPYSFAAQHGIENNAFAVVLCKDCEHRVYVDMGDEIGEIGGCELFKMAMPYDNFCSYGERKGNAENH